MKKFFLIILFVFLVSCSFLLWRNFVVRAYYNKNMEEFTRKIVETYPEIEESNVRMYKRFLAIRFSYGDNEISKETIISIKKDAAQFINYDKVKKLGESYWNKDRYPEYININLYDGIISGDKIPKYTIKSELRNDFDLSRATSDRPLDEKDQYYKYWTITDLTTDKIIYEDPK